MREKIWFSISETIELVERIVIEFYDFQMGLEMR